MLQTCTDQSSQSVNHSGWPSRISQVRPLPMGFPAGHRFQQQSQVSACGVLWLEGQGFCTVGTTQQQLPSHGDPARPQSQAMVTPKPSPSPSPSSLVPSSPSKQFEAFDNSNNNPGLIYSPTDIAMESTFTYWTFHCKNMLSKMEFLEIENKRLHSKITNLKQLVSEMKHQENNNIHLQNPLTDSLTLQSKISSIKNLWRDKITTDLV